MRSRSLQIWYLSPLLRHLCHLHTGVIVILTWAFLSFLPRHLCHFHMGVIVMLTWASISVTFTQESLLPLHGRLCRIFPALSLREQDKHGEHPRAASAQRKVTQESGSCPFMAARETADWVRHVRLSHRGLLTLRTSAAPQAQSLEEAQVLVSPVWRPRSSLQPRLCSDGR